ncbi:MAG: plastocyanin/azurin family copper-binding protein [Balneolaceae bacterium]
MYFIDHTDRVPLIDQKGQIRRHYQGSELAVNEVIKDINKLDTISGGSGREAADSVGRTYLSKTGANMIRIYTFMVLAGFVAMAAACGNGEETPEQQTTATATADDDVRTIEIVGIDRMKFVVAEELEGVTLGEQVGEEFVIESIQAAPGEELSINFETRSQIPPTAMAHNWVLLDQGTDVQTFIDQSAAAANDGYIAPALEDQVIVATGMLGGGDSDTITFTVPDTPGEYTFVCTFPGHYGGGMVGTLIVE